MLFFLSLAAIVQAYAQSAKPIFSDNDKEYWYYLVFESGKTVVADQGLNNPLVTRIADKERKNQLWKFLGNENEFILINKETDNAAGFLSGYVRSVTKEDASKFRLVASPLKDMENGWEIEYTEKGDEYNKWNQWGGS